MSLRQLVVQKSAAHLEEDGRAGTLFEQVFEHVDDGFVDVAFGSLLQDAQDVQVLEAALEDIEQRNMLAAHKLEELCVVDVLAVGDLFFLALLESIV